MLFKRLITGVFLIPVILGFILMAVSCDLDEGENYIKREDIVPITKFSMPDSAAVNDYAKMDITARLMDGRVLFSVTDYDVRIGDFSYILTDGLSEGIRYMKEGEHAKILTPFYRAYGIYGLSARDVYGTSYSYIGGDRKSVV